MKGIDVSKHHGVIDWNKVKESGIEFVVIRAGYGKNNVDSQFINNICGAHTAGLKIMIYWFIYALNEADAIANADKCDSTISLYKDIVDMVFADWNMILTIILSRMESPRPRHPVQALSELFWSVYGRKVTA